MDCVYSKMTFRQMHNFLYVCTLIKILTIKNDPYTFVRPLVDIPPQFFFIVSRNLLDETEQKRTISFVHRLIFVENNKLIVIRHFVLQKAFLDSNVSFVFVCAGVVKID